VWRRNKPTGLHATLSGWSPKYFHADRLNPVMRTAVERRRSYSARTTRCCAPERWIEEFDKLPNQARKCGH